MKEEDFYKEASSIFKNLKQISASVKNLKNEKLNSEKIVKLISEKVNKKQVEINEKINSYFNVA